jgi:hypothetical protein
MNINNTITLELLNKPDEDGIVTIATNGYRYKYSDAVDRVNENIQKNIDIFVIDSNSCDDECIKINAENYKNIGKVVSFDSENYTVTFEITDQLTLLDADKMKSISKCKISPVHWCEFTKDSKDIRIVNICEFQLE